MRRSAGRPPARTCSTSAWASRTSTRPAPAAQAGMQAIQKGLTRYPPNVGIAELRKAIAQNLSRMSGGRTIDPDQIIVSSGSKQSIFNACFTLFGPKDRVLIPAPAWVSLSPDRASLPGRAGAGAGRSRVGPQGQRQGPRPGEQQADPRPHPLLAVQSHRRGVHAGRAAVDRRVGQGQRGLDHLGRDLPPDQLRPRPGAVAARSARRPARAHRRHLRREQGVRDDRLAHRRGAGAARI